MTATAAGTDLFIQDPDAIRDYGFDWTTRLAAGETITAFEVTATPGVTVDTPPSSQSNGVVTVWVTSGVAGALAQVTCHVTTSSGRQDDWTFNVLIQQTGTPAPGETTAGLVYATVADLADWLAGLGLTPPANATGMLRYASYLIARACDRNPYRDLPTDTDAPILRDATTAQVAAWVTLGVSPAAAGLDSAPLKSRKIGTADLSYDTTGQAAARTAAATQLAPEAMQILVAGGLYALDLPVWTSDTDRLADYGLDRPRSIGLRPWSWEQWQNL